MKYDIYHSFYVLDLVYLNRSMRCDLACLILWFIK